MRWFLLCVSFSVLQQSLLSTQLNSTQLNKTLTLNLMRKTGCQKVSFNTNTGKRCSEWIDSVGSLFRLTCCLLCWIFLLFSSQQSFSIVLTDSSCWLTPPFANNATKVSKSAVRPSSMDGAKTYNRHNTVIVQYRFYTEYSTCIHISILSMLVLTSKLILVYW